MVRYFFSHLKTSLIFVLFRYVFLLFVIVSGVITIVASGDGGGGYAGREFSPPPNTAPSISNLSYSPTSTTVGSNGGMITVTGSIDFSDGEGNVSILYIAILDSTDNRIQQIEEVLEGLTGITSGEISFEVSVDTTGAESYTFEIYVVDVYGSESNELVGAFDVIS